MVSKVEVSTRRNGFHPGHQRSAYLHVSSTRGRYQTNPRCPKFMSMTCCPLATRSSQIVLKLTSRNISMSLSLAMHPTSSAFVSSATEILTHTVWPSTRRSSPKPSSNATIMIPLRSHPLLSPLSKNLYQIVRATLPQRSQCIILRLSKAS